MNDTRFIHYQRPGQVSLLPVSVSGISSGSGWSPNTIFLIPWRSEFPGFFHFSS